MKKSELIKIIKEEISHVLEQKVDLTTKILATNMFGDLCSQMQGVIDKYSLPVEDLRAGQRGGVEVIVHKTFSKNIADSQPLAQYCKQGTLSEQSPQIQDLNGKPAIDTGTSKLADAHVAARTLAGVLRKHLAKKGMPLGSGFVKGPNGNLFLTATGK